MRPHPMRSKLFVPGERDELIPKALATGADQVALDLEDAVPAVRKPRAREQVHAFLQGTLAREQAARLIVRVNAVASLEFREDLRVFADAPPVMVNLPKVESAADVQAALDALDRVRGDDATSLLCTVETPRGLRLAHEIAGASPRVVGLQLGLVDLFAQAGIDRGDAAAVHAAMFALAMAGAEHGVPVFDSAYPPLHDEAGFRAEALRARALGYAGKSCIHPRQVPWAHAVFTPTAEELARARRIVEAAARRGGGVFELDGAMVDAPIIEHSRRVLARGGGAEGAA